jgi:hypothetical protein
MKKILLVVIALAFICGIAAGQERKVIAKTDSAARLSSTSIGCSRVIVQALPTNTGYIAVGVSKGIVSGCKDSILVLKSHGLTTGQRITVAEIKGNTALNDDWTVTVISADSVSCDGATGNGIYGGGGIWTPISAVAGYEKGDQLAALGSTVIYIDDVSKVWINGTATQGVTWRSEK